MYWLSLLCGHVVASATGVVLNSFLTHSNLIHQSMYFHVCCLDHFLVAPKVHHCNPQLAVISLVYTLMYQSWIQVVFV